MHNNSYLAIGFDRYISLDWANHALELAISRHSPNSLDAWLHGQISGQESASRTAQLLRNLWFKKRRETDTIRDKALDIASKTTPSQWLVLHWGMALASFPFFQNTISIIGRLLRLQGVFNTTEVRQRLMEAYSNKGTVPRALNRGVQTLGNWGVIHRTQKNAWQALPRIPIGDTQILAWLLRCAISREADRHFHAADLLRLPELFPFEIADAGMRAITESPDFVVMREGMNHEYVSLAVNM